MPEPTIFDDAPRTDDHPSRHTEARSGFLNRTAGPVFDRIRAALEDWYQHYPDAGRTDLRARLRSDANDTFSGAFWELYQHETLTRMGFGLTLHPDVAGTAKHPDFLAQRPGEPGFYLEATLASPSREERAAKRRLGAVYDVLNDLSTPNFFLQVEVEKQGPAAPATGRLRRDLLAWLDSLDPDALLAEPDRFVMRHAHEHVWDEAGWRMEFTPYRSRLSTAASQAALSGCQARAPAMLTPRAACAARSGRRLAGTANLTGPTSLRC